MLLITAAYEANEYVPKGHIICFPIHIAKHTYPKITPFHMLLMYVRVCM